MALTVSWSSGVTLGVTISKSQNNINDGVKALA